MERSAWPQVAFGGSRGILSNLLKQIKPPVKRISALPGTGISDALNAGWHLSGVCVNLWLTLG